MITIPARPAPGPSAAPPTREDASQRRRDDPDTLRKIDEYLADERPRCHPGPNISFGLMCSCSVL